MHLKNHQELLDKVQRKITKIISKLRAELQVKARYYLPSMEEKRMRGDLIMTCKFLKQIDGIDSEQVFKRCKAKAARKQNMILSKKLAKKN